jgi:hypothetical protein
MTQPHVRLPQWHRGLHLCGNPDWEILFTLPLEIISFNARVSGDTVSTYESMKRFIEQWDIISWGIVHGK